MLKTILTFLLLLGACSTYTPPPEYSYQEIPAGKFTLASWQKITAPEKPVKIYIEGDGHAFNAHGRVSADPTPRGTLLRELAFKDSAPNVVYLARPCQYINSPECNPEYWSDARFAPEIIDSSAKAVRSLSQVRPVTLIGYSGGATVAALIAVRHPDIPVRKLVTVAGNLDHQAWTTWHHLPPLNGSLNLADYRQELSLMAQSHYLGTADEVIPPHLTKNFIGDTPAIHLITGASHDRNWEKAFPDIWAE